MKRNKDGLGSFQLTMLALGSVIGGSFFLGSAVAIKASGPSVLIAFAFGGVLVYFILKALSEMTVKKPNAGSFRTYATEAFGTATGFVVGWVYWTGMILAMSSEATAVSILLRSWNQNISIILIGSSIIIGVTLLNLFGAKQLSKLESGLAFIKIFSIISFIIIGIILITGLFTTRAPIGLDVLSEESFFPGGIKSIAGSMLIIMFTYAGFEIIGLASTEVKTPNKTIPKAIRNTVFGLVGLYMLSNAVLLPLIPTGLLSDEVSPLVAALTRHGVNWAGNAINVVLISAILSTMLAVMFGIGRMLHSLAEDGLAPKLLLSKTEVPYREILSSGLAMLLALWFGTFFPNVYLFLVSSSGFAILFSYAVIMLTHIQFCKKENLKNRKSTNTSFPRSSLFTFIALVLIIVSMPFVQGQTSGLIAGISIVLFYLCCYRLVYMFKHAMQREDITDIKIRKELLQEVADELANISNKRKND